MQVVLLHVLVMPLSPFVNCLPALRVLPHRNSQGRNTRHATSQAGNIFQLLLRPARQTRAHRRLVNTQVIFTHERSPAGVSRMTCTEQGFRNRAQSKMVCSESNWCSHVTARDPAEGSITVASALGTAAETAWGVTATRAPSLQQDGSPGLNFSI